MINKNISLRQKSGNVIDHFNHFPIDMTFKNLGWERVDGDDHWSPYWITLGQAQDRCYELTCIHCGCKKACGPKYWQYDTECSLFLP